MKAIHKKTGHEYRLEEVLGDTVTLEGLTTGNKRRVPHSLYRKHYNLVDEPVELEMDETLENELLEANRIAMEVLMESKTKKGNKEAPSSSIEALKKESNKKPKPTKVVSTATSLKALCDELGVEPGKARRLLRSANIEKPGGSWEWTDTTQITKIRELLK